MNRRLPIYFLIDVSESMAGEPLQLVEEGMAAIIKELRTDPYAIETAWISILVFAGAAKTLVPLQELIHFYPPRFPLGGGTSLGRGLGHLMFEMRRNRIVTTEGQKGDWKPIVFLFTDGVPTDDAQPAIREWKEQWARAANLVAVSFGEDTDTALLSSLTEHVLLFRNSGPDAYKRFFKWVTDSIRTSSQSVDRNASGFELSKTHGDELSSIDLTKAPPVAASVDPNFVVLSAKCQNTLRPYLIKYKRSLQPSGIGDLQTRSYRMVGAYPVDAGYAELTDTSVRPARINTGELTGAPPCPCCGNPYGLAMCRCGGIHCIGEEPVSTCPWCGNQGRYGAGEGGFDVNRTQG